MKRSKKTKREKLLPYDKNLFYLILGLLVVGLIFIADISAPQALSFFNDKYFFFKQQIIWALVGIVVLFVFSFIKYDFWKKLALPMFLVSIIFLILVLIPSLGYKALGARRWLNLGIVRFQPSELIKLTLAIYLAKVAESKNKPLAYFIPLILVCGLIMLQPDLGTTLVVGAIGIVQIFVAGVPMLYFIASLVLGIISVVILILTSPYRRDRLFTFFKVTQDPLGKAYHIRQILLAIGSGGLFGVGLGQSRQKYLFLPEAATDSIFAAISEEIGFVGSVVLIFLFVIFLYRGFKIATNSTDTFSKVLAVGLTAYIGGQALLNLASMTALTPLTGIPLPFFSYGGSSLLVVLASCGILLNISRFNQRVTKNKKTFVRKSFKK